MDPEKELCYDLRDNIISRRRSRYERKGANM